MAGHLRFALAGAQVRNFKTALATIKELKSSELMIEAVPEKVRPRSCCSVNFRQISPDLDTRCPLPSPPLQVYLRGINSSQSAYIALTFSSEFFDLYEVSGSVIVQGGVLIKVRSPAIAC